MLLRLYKSKIDMEHGRIGCCQLAVWHAHPVRAVSGVTEATVNLAAESATVHAANMLDVAALAAVVETAGYPRYTAAA